MCSKHRQRIDNCNHLNSWNPGDFLDIFLCTIKELFLMFAGRVLGSHVYVERLLMFVHSYFDSSLIAATVRVSIGSVLSISVTTPSTRALSYHIAISEVIRVMSVVFFGVFFHPTSFFERSIDPLRSTMIFCAVFLPIHGTLERSASSSNCIARMSSSSPSPRSARAVLPPMPLTLRSWRKSERSETESNPKSVCPASVIWWCIQSWIFFLPKSHPSTVGETRISKPIPVPSARTHIVMPSMWSRSPWIYEYIACILWKLDTIANSLRTFMTKSTKSPSLPGFTFESDISSFSKNTKFGNVVFFTKIFADRF